jgi:hypothetical protein
VKLALRALLVLAILVIGYLGVGLVVADQLSAPSGSVAILAGIR